MSLALQRSVLHYRVFEKEATAIIEAVRKWSHLLSRNTFTLVTNMFDSGRRTKIENDKVQQCCMKLASSFMSYNIVRDSKTLDLTSLLEQYVLQIQTVLAAFKICARSFATRESHECFLKYWPFLTTDAKRVYFSAKYVQK